MAIMPNKLVYGDQIQIRLDPAQLEAKRRGEWGRLYIDHQAKKATLFSNAVFWHVGSIISAFAAVQLGSFFLFVFVVFSVLSAKSFFDFGYGKNTLDDWESKLMVRIDK